MQNSENNIKTIAKAVKVMRAISIGNSRLSDISREVNINKNGVFRLLHSMMKEGMVVQDVITRGYYLGPTLLDIMENPMKSHEHFINIAYHEMEDLKQATGETISLNIKLGTEQMMLRKVMGTRDVVYIGKTTPIFHLWVGSTGKALMSQLAEHDLDFLLKNIILPGDTPFSITDKEAFKKEIMKVKERGYAMSVNETEMGVASIAIPIRNYIVPAAMAISGPEDRIVSKTEEYFKSLKAKADKIMRQLSGM
jgi:IclR family transcriptional regulator, KDG regulon repressor